MVKSFPMVLAKLSSITIFVFRQTLANCLDRGAHEDSMVLQDHRDLVDIMVATAHPEHPEHQEDRDLWDPRDSMGRGAQKVLKDPKARPVREGLETTVLAFTGREKIMRTVERIMMCLFQI